MSQLPITSRIKRSPLLKGSPYKQTETPEASVIAAGKDKEVKKKEIIETGASENFEGEKATGKAAEDWAKQNEFCKGKPKGTPGCAGFHKFEGGGTEEITTTTTEKGDDVIAPTYSKRTGDVQTNFEGRQLGRQTKFKNRLVRQSKNKLAKAEDKMANFQKKYSKPGIDKKTGKPISTFTAPKAGEKGYKQYMKLDSKITENKNELADFEAGSSNQAEVMRSGKTIGKNYRMDEDRRDTAADQTKDERIAQVRAEQEAANNIVSNSQAENAVEVNNSVTSTETEKKPADTTQYGKYETKPTAFQMRSAFKMKAKSPAAKKLQGNQGQLPQHLQDAIKAAPESPAKLGPLAAIAGKALVGALVSKAASGSKMRSGFKMKGYGKK